MAIGVAGFATLYISKSSLLGFAGPSPWTRWIKTMTPAARLQMAIDILEGLNATPQPAERYLKDWFKARRFAGSGDRRAIAERVFQIFRHHAVFAHRLNSEAPRAMMI